MEKQLVVGRTYAVTTSSTCNVTDANGTLITTASAGQQVVFVAPTTTVTFSDDSASVVAVFKLALAKTRLFELLGGGKSEPDSDLPSGYIPALFLQTGSGAKIETGIIPSHVTGARGVVMESARWCESYTASANRFVAPCASKSSGSRYYYFSDSKWNLPSIGGDSSVELGEYISELNWLNSRKARLNFPAMAYDETVALETPALTATAGIAVGSYATKIKSAQFSEGTKITHDFVPAISNAGQPCFFEKISKTPFYNAGYNFLVIGLTTAQARKLGNLPEDAPTKTLTVSLPASIVDGETVTDAEVQAALETAAAKGWTITKQYYTE